MSSCTLSFNVNIDQSCLFFRVRRVNLIAIISRLVGQICAFITRNSNDFPRDSMTFQSSIACIEKEAMHCCGVLIFFAQRRLCNIKSSSTFSPWLMTSHLLATSLLNSNCERTLQITLHLCFKDLYYVWCGHSASSFCVRQKPNISQKPCCFGFRQKKYQRIASVSLENEQLWITNCNRLIIFIEIMQRK